jgi:anti-sigma B factor antagonist
VSYIGFVATHIEISKREHEGVVILDMKGRLVLGNASVTLRDKTNEETALGNTKIILNLEHVDHIDSTGLGSMVICFTSMQKAGGALKLLKLNRRNLELLLLTKLTTVFEIFNEEQDAINSFFTDRTIQRFDILSFVQQKEKE